MCEIFITGPLLLVFHILKMVRGGNVAKNTDMSLLRKATGVVYVLVVVLYLVSAILMGALVLVLGKVVFFRSPKYEVWFNQLMQRWFLSLFTYLIERNSNIRIRATGDTIPRKESALVLSNHLNQDWVG